MTAKLMMRPIFFFCRDESVAIGDLDQLKKISHSVAALETAIHGYISTGGCISVPSFRRTKSAWASEAATIPRTEQRIQSGKNEPAMLNEGARWHPVSAIGTTSAGSAIHPRFKLGAGRVMVVGFVSEKEFAANLPCGMQDSTSAS